MSNATVLELKEKDAYQNYANGDYKVDLNQPLTVYQGDTIEIKNVFLDTLSIGSQQTIIEDDLILNFTIGYYIVNSDPTASATTRIFDELAPKFFQNDYKDDDPPKDVAPSDSVVVKFPLNDTVDIDNSGNFVNRPTIPMDFMKYVLCKDTFEGDNSDNYRILTEITFVREVNVDNPDKLPTNFVGTKTLQIPVNYMAEDLTIKQYMITDSFENYESIGNNYYIRTLTLNIVGRNADDGVNWNGTNFGDFTAFQGDVVPGAGNFNSDIKKIGFVFQVVQDTFDDVMIPITKEVGVEIPKGSYTPPDLCDLINRKMTEITRMNGNRPESNILLTSNDGIAGSPTILVREDACFKMTIPKSTATAITQELYIGSNQFALNYDDVLNKYQFQFLHMPCYEDQTGQIINRFAITRGFAGLMDIDQEQTTSSVSNLPLVRTYGSNGGIFFTELSAISATTRQPFDFWSGKLGFTQVNSGDGNDIIFAPDYLRGTDVSGSGTKDLLPRFLKLNEGINTTRARDDVDGIITKTSTAGKVPPIFLNNFKDNGKPIDAGSDKTKSIDAVKNVFEIDDTGYFLIEIDAGFNNTLISSDTTKTKIKCIAGKYYSSSSYTSGADGGIAYTHRGNPLTLSSFSIRILDSNSKLAQNIGNDNTIFLNIVRAEPEPQQQSKK